MERKTGVVLHVVAKKGYWFVLFEHRRIFCHVSNWSEVKLPEVGDQISFELGPARQSNFQQQAVQIRPEPSDQQAAGESQVQGGGQ